MDRGFVSNRFSLAARAQARCPRPPTLFWLFDHNHDTGIAMIAMKRPVVSFSSKLAIDRSIEAPARLIFEIGISRNAAPDLGIEKNSQGSQKPPYLPQSHTCNLRKGDPDPKTEASKNRIVIVRTRIADTGPES